MAKDKIKNSTVLSSINIWTDAEQHRYNTVKLTYENSINISYFFFDLNWKGLFFETHYTRSNSEKNIHF
jgi:hypothetical protein